jgi:hypothetical protein
MLNLIAHRHLKCNSLYSANEVRLDRLPILLILRLRLGLSWSAGKALQRPCQVDWLPAMSWRAAVVGVAKFWRRGICDSGPNKTYKYLCLSISTLFSAAIVDLSHTCILYLQNVIVVEIGEQRGSSLVIHSVEMYFGGQRLRSRCGIRNV